MLLVDVKFTNLYFSLEVSCTFHKSCPYKCLGAWHKTYQVIRVIQSHNIFLGNMLVLLCWFGVVCVCSLHVSCTFSNQVPRNLEKLIANPVKANDNSWANPTEIHTATWRIKHVCQKYIFVWCCCLLWNSQFYMFPWRFLAHSLSHAPINVLENDTKHIKSFELPQNRNIFVRNMLVLSCWFSVVCVCSLQVSCTFCSAYSQESWEVDCQSCQSTW